MAPSRAVRRSKPLILLLRLVRHGPGLAIAALALLMFGLLWFAFPLTRR
jgi:hypothetical protein